MPQPNLYVLKPNMQFFVKHHVTEIFPQADPFNEMGELSELRAYLLAKLMWNPDYDVDKGINEFLEGYYGAAAKPIRAYIDMLHKKATDERIHMNAFAKLTVPLFSPDIMERANVLFDKAEQLADNEEVLFRVKVARLSIQFLELVKMPADDPGRQSLSDHFFEIADKAGINYLGNVWGYDSEHMKNRKGDDIMIWSCPECTKSFYAFDKADLDTRENAHRTLWCPITGNPSLR